MANPTPAYLHLLPDNEPPLGKSLATAINKRIGDIPVPLKLLNDPFRAPTPFLNLLAFEVGVDIWNEDWDELKKRSVIAETIRTKSILGTRTAMERYVALTGGKVLDVLAPPQTPFISKGLEGTADYEQWLGKLPQLRVYFGNDQGTVEGNQCFIGKTAFIGNSAPTTDRGRRLLGRRAFFYDPTTDTETRITLADLHVDEASVTEQARIPGTRAPQEAFVGGFVGRFVVNNPANPPKTISYRLPARQSLDVGSLAVSLAASFNPVNTRFDRVPVTGVANATQCFIGRDFVGRGIVSSSGAAVDFYDRIYLADPKVSAPVTKGTTFIGRARLQMPAFRAEVLVDAQETIDPKIAVVGRRFIGNCFVAKQDDRKRKKILEAIELSKAGRDRIFVDFQVTSIIKFGDRPKMNSSFKFGQRLPRLRL